ncbi:phosphoglucomutase (alpha-D-glucose-1,6-bisphosphate-dependent) [Glaciimonas immobilis]|uniref:Phosphoglucomutase n=1 Tax=Glaciimonas immobilis TaxID=728004 RepID=A0A840S1T5_9BURK|nr:phosphoglucomutase (alpha-D-glucose-1,6-bisphosphate-dependent) [Glaciimonas immobilis]KAF3995914.1 alpha-D-glucose phosphate-specific phosphoglucomutase [Glaciimonas immobilis]MBB5202641.1 phosphoglucomutase [Glaciimonas immobilis]
MNINPLAGKLPPQDTLVNIPKLVTAYYSNRPDVNIAAQQVSFGTSGHRGSSFQNTFNEWHLLAITQSICEYRKRQNISGPLFLGIDTHALSIPAAASALEVLAANGVDVMLAQDDEYTPTPVISHAILAYNRGRTTGLADGIVVTPSHNPPDNGGIKYNLPNGGPADTSITDWIQAAANNFIRKGLHDVRRVPFEKALLAPTTHRYDYLSNYVYDLGNVIEMEVIKSADIHPGVDPLGGAGVRYWERIANRYHIDLTVVSNTIDPTFGFMTLDRDGKIRMDPSSPYAMQRLIDLKNQFDVAFGCDTDHDRHGIVTRSSGLMPSNHYLTVAIDYLFRHRPHWRHEASVGKTVVSSQMIDRVCARLGRKLVEMPVGFKWFVDGLFDGSMGFGGEESAGAAFLRLDGSVWTTDKDGITAALLAAEMTARTGNDPAQAYQKLTETLGAPIANRLEAPATRAQKAALSALSPEQISSTELAGEKITGVLTRAPGNNAAIGGLKVCTKNGWFAARPSGTEEIYKIYAESFIDDAHLELIIKEAQVIVDSAMRTR